MREIQTSFYVCEICQEQYVSKEQAIDCESRPLREDKGARIGDIVLITRGQGAGEKAKVIRLGVADKYRGHYAWERYWHTRTITADLLNNTGSRFLTFDDYELVQQEARRMEE